MINTEMLTELFLKELDRLCAENGLSGEEKERIAECFRKALLDPYMDDGRIYECLTRG